MTLVRTQLQSLTNLDNTPPGQVDLCSVICNATSGNRRPFCCLDPEGRCFLFETCTHLTSATNAPKFVSLDNCLQTAVSALSTKLRERRKRLPIARTLAYTLLTYHETSWLPSVLTKKQLYLLATQTGSLSSVFLHHQFGRLQQNSKGDRNYCKALAFWYGVIFLELWHGKTLEERPFRKMLINAQNNHQSEDHINLLAAVDWLHETKHQLDNDFGDLSSLVPIPVFLQRCLHFDFGDRDGLDGKGFRLAFYNEVYLPVDRLASEMGCD
jgi:hypothetical protein